MPSRMPFVRPSMPTFGAALLPGLLALLGLPVPGFGQAASGADPSASPAPRAVSVSLGVPGVSGVVDSPFFEFTTVAVQWTDAEPGRTGLDLGVGFVPRLVPEGALVALGRLGAVRPVALGGAGVLLPSAGVSVLGGVGPGGSGTGLGVHAGLAGVFALEGGSFGVRPGVSVHRFLGAPDPIWLAEIGVVWLRGRR